MPSFELTRPGSLMAVRSVRSVRSFCHDVRVRSIAWSARASFRAVATRAVGQPTRAFWVS